MSEFKRGDKVVAYRTDQDLSAFTGRVLSYNENDKHYLIALDGDPGRFVSVPADKVNEA